MSLSIFGVLPRGRKPHQPRQAPPPVMPEGEAPRRPRKPKGPPYLLFLLGVALVMYGVRGSNRFLLGAGAALFSIGLLIGYARAPSRPPRPPT